MDDSRTLDWDRLTRHVGKDPGFLRDLLALFQEEKNKHVLSINKSLAENDRDLLKKSAHALKGIVGNLCAPRIFEDVSRFETSSRQGVLSEVKDLWPKLEKSLEELAADLKRRISELTL